MKKASDVFANIREQKANPSIYADIEARPTVASHSGPVVRKEEDEGRFTPKKPQYIKNTAVVSPRPSSDSANVKLKEEDKLNEVSNELLTRYKNASEKDARESDKKGDFKRGDKRFSGIIKATIKQFDNDKKNSMKTESTENKKEKEDDKPPFDPPYETKNRATPGKYGKGYSTARHLARMAARKAAGMKEETLEEDKHSFIGKILRKNELKKKVDQSWRDAANAHKDGDDVGAHRAMSRHIRYTNLERPGTWTKVKEEYALQEGRPSQRHPLEGHDYHKKTNAELVHIAKDAHAAAEAMKSHNTTAENKYRDQANDSATVRYWRQKNGTPNWYKKKYGIKEEVDDLNEDIDSLPPVQPKSRKADIVRSAYESAKSKKKQKEVSNDKFQADPELTSQIIRND